MGFSRAYTKTILVEKPEGPLPSPKQRYLETPAACAVKGVSNTNQKWRPVRLICQLEVHLSLPNHHTYMYNSNMTQANICKSM
jgi:hypothetical protein